MKNYVAVPALCLLACCSVPRPVSTPAPAAPAPIAVPPPPAPPPSPRWEDWPYTAGAWRYGRQGSETAATFLSPSGAPLFALRCQVQTRTIAFARAGIAPVGATFAFTTSSGTAAYTAQAAAEGAVATTSGSDPYLDKIAFSRGRFVVVVTGTERLVLPAWAELARTIEDCR